MGKLYAQLLQGKLLIMVSYRKQIYSLIVRNKACIVLNSNENIHVEFPLEAASSSSEIVMVSGYSQYPTSGSHRSQSIDS